MLLVLALAGAPGCSGGGDGDEDGGDGDGSPGDDGGPGGGDSGSGGDDGGSGGDDGGGSGGDDGGVSGYDCDDPHPSWLLCEDFEQGGGDFDTWFEQSDFVTSVGRDDRGRIDLSSEQARSGDWSVYMPAAESSGYQGADLTWVDCEGEQETNCTPSGHDQLYFRVWVRFAEDHQYVHHFLNVGGLDRFWPYGSAGCLPNGESGMGTTVDFDEGTHESYFYTYHLDMSCDTNCDRYADVDAICSDCADKGFPTCTEQEQCCWGNHFRPDEPKPFPVGEWFCFEMTMEANTPGETDGSMAYWIDGELAHRAEGIRWRTTSDLQLNRARVQHYIASGDADSSNRVWFDDAVVSTERIGCE
ncbi:MAG: hypothetical protein ACOCUS_04280 [Polyangiales bacterium]